MSKIKVKSYRIPITKFREGGGKPVRIALIADLHNRLFGEGNSELVDVIQRQYPDMVFSAGDLTVCSGKDIDLDVGISLLKRLACGCPVYCVNGNHEYRTKIYAERYKGIYAGMTSGLRRIGVRLLENEKERVDVGGAKLTIHGLELPARCYKKMGSEFISAEEIRGILGLPDEGRFNILLVHHPVFFESYALWGAQLTLCGHLHGGLVRLPFVGGLISPQMKLFPRYDYGMFEKYGRRMVVTSGLGSHSIALRVNNPPEVVMLELT